MPVTFVRVVNVSCEWIDDRAMANKQMGIGAKQGRKLRILRIVGKCSNKGALHAN